MSGQLQSLGLITVAQAIPGLAELESIAKAAQLAAKAQITGKLAGLASVSAALTVPPLPGATAAAAAKMAVQLALNPSIAAPSLQVAANAKVAAELTAQLSGLVLPDFGLGAAGIAAYKYTGTVDSLGSKLAAATSGGLPGGSGSDVCYATIFVTTAPAAAAALARVLI